MELKGKVKNCPEKDKYITVLYGLKYVTYSKI